MADDSIYDALARAQLEYTAIPKSRTAKVPTKSGGEYSYKYADIGDVLAAVRPVLAKHGIALTQLIDSDEHGTFLRSQLLRGDEMIESPRMPLAIEGVSPQQVGSQLTYFRRYQLCALTGCVAEDDDDGQAASDVRGKARPRGVDSDGVVHSSPAGELASDAQIKNIRARLRPLAALLEVQTDVYYTRLRVPALGGLTKREASALIDRLAEISDGKQPHPEPLDDDGTEPF